MRLTPNMNGTSRKELVEQRLAVYRACAELAEALGQAWPNGRDYQLAAPGECVKDRDEWEAFAVALRSWGERMMGEAVEIQE